MVLPSSGFFRWSAIGITVAIWVLSFLPGEATPHVPGTDKTHHLLAYATCMLAWVQCVLSGKQRLWCAAVLTLMGALIECGQGMTSYRHFDWMDMVANTCGVAIGFTIGELQARWGWHPLKRTMG